MLHALKKYDLFHISCHPHQLALCGVRIDRPQLLTCCGTPPSASLPSLLQSSSCVELTGSMLSGSTGQQQTPGYNRPGQVVFDCVTWRWSVTAISAQMLVSRGYSWSTSAELCKPPVRCPQGTGRQCCPCNSSGNTLQGFCWHAAAAAVPVWLISVLLSL